MFFLAIFFWLCKWSILNAFQSEKWCFIISRCFAVSYSWRYIFVYPLYTWHLQVFFLSYVFNNNPHITHRSCEIKAALIVGREVTKGGFVNLCTSFCSFNSLNVSVSLRASGHNILLWLNLWNDKKYWETELHKWEWKISKWRCDAYIDRYIDTKTLFLIRKTSH